MQFNSIEFLFYFLPLFLAVYRIFPARARFAVLTAGSLLFYAFASAGNLWWVAVLAVIAVLSYFAGLTLGTRKNSVLLGIYLGVLAALLTFFKLFHGGRYLPAGMSFYLFQVAAYLIDVYREKLPAERKFLTYTSQITMFPKLLSGPLMAPRILKLEDTFFAHSAERFHDGLQELILGLAFKVILANRIGGLWNQIKVLGYGSVSSALAWLALAAYAMQLYFDFYGYSLMAIGIGKMLGYDLPRNFDSPYASKTVSEFYRRWHITLGAWFREYVYIPLGGNRKGSLRTILNLAAVWLLTGLWHGIGGGYLLWAGFLFLLIVNERLWFGKYLKRSHLLSHLYLVFVILLSWVPFAIGSISDMVAFSGRLFGIGGMAANPQDYLLWGESYFGMLIAGIIFATPLPRKLWEKVRYSTIADILFAVLFWVVVYYISTAAQDPFLYFQY